MDKKKLVIILIIVLVIALAVMATLFYLNREQTKIDFDNNSNAPIGNGDQLPIDQQNIPSQEGSETDNVNSQQMIDPAEQAKSDAINMAKFFVEMIGTYSPGVQFQNVIDLQPMMTQKMVSWSEDFIKRNMETGEGVQERISTKVLKIEETKMAEGSAEIRVNTRRTRVDDAGQTNYSQEAEVELLKINGVWKVNNLIWK